MFRSALRPDGGVEKTDALAIVHKGWVYTEESTSVEKSNAGSVGRGVRYEQRPFLFSRFSFPIAAKGNNLRPEA